MNDLKNYFNAPLFESIKTTYACRYQNEFELRLMQKINAEPKIKNFHQPLLMALVKNSDNEQIINIDFWIEYFTGKIDLLFVEKDFVISDTAKIYILSNNIELSRSGRFGFAVVNSTNFHFRRIPVTNLKISRTPSIEDFYFVSFDWLN